MSGIAGIVQLGRRKEEIKDCVEFLVGSLLHENWQKSHIDYSDNYGFEKVDLEENFTPLESNEEMIAGFYGYAVAYKDIKSEALVEIDVEKSDGIIPKKIIDAYRLNKLGNLVPTINGLFSFFVYDKQKNKLIIGNDRYGLKPVYYRKINNGIIFSSEFNGLVEIKQKIPNLRNTINKEAVVEYFTFQHLFGTKTMIKEISLFPPASILTYANEKISLTKYWKPQFNENNDITEDEIIEKVDQKLIKAVKRRIPKNQENIGVSLSGGLDSRIILHILKKSALENNFKIFSFNYGINRNNLDSLLSKQLAYLYGTTHSFIPVNYKSCLEKGLTNIGVEYSGFDFRCIPFYEKVRKEGIKHIFLGEFGDCSFGKDIKKEYINATNEMIFSEALFKEWNRIIPYDIQKIIFRKEIHHYLDSSKRNLLNLIHEYKQSSFANIFNLLNILEFERRHCASISLAAKEYVHVYSPYLDYEFQDYFYKLPLHYKYKERMTKRYIKEKLFPASTIPRNTLELLGNESIRMKIWVSLLKLKNYFALILLKIFQKEMIKPVKTKGIDGKWILINNWEFIKKVLLGGRYLWRTFLDENTVFEILEKDPNKLKNWEVHFVDKLVMCELWFQKTRLYIDNF